MNIVIDEVLAGDPRYTIKDNSGVILYDNVQIVLKTQVTTAGTPLNKALFDSIQTDLNTRLLISNKATTSEAQTGTNDTKYMTPLKVRQALNHLTTITDYPTGNTSETLYTFDNNSTSIIKIEGTIGSPSSVSSSYPRITLNGQGISCYMMDAWQNNFENIHLGKDYGSSQTKTPFWLEFNMATKTFNGFLFISQTAGTSTYFYVSPVHRIFYKFNDIGNKQKHFNTVACCNNRNRIGGGKMEKEFETEVLTRLARIETKLDDYDNIRQKAEESRAKTFSNERRIADIEDKQKWLERTAIGAIIIGGINIILIFVKLGLGIN